MSKITFNSSLYDAIISDGDLILQSLSQDVIFPKGGHSLREDAEGIYFAESNPDRGLNTFIGEYIESMVEIYIKDHKEEAQIIEHFVN